ncbi:MAG: class I SAM-dependent methyltransferase [Elusimicrobiota bacterium]|nr:class I SAM-dependent methyltransferase [Elusimicrobiota bacterium]
MSTPTTTDGLSRRAFLLRALSALPLLSSRTWAAALAALGDEGPGNFAAVYGDEKQRDKFFRFLQVVFNLYPEDRFHQLIIDLVAERKTDKAVYLGLQEKLPGIDSFLSPVTYALPALKVQKEEMVRQTLEFLGPGPAVDGYVEIGSPARYASLLRRRARVKGPVFIVNDYEPSYSPVDLMERGGLAKLGSFIPLGNYDPLPADRVPDASVDLVGNYIGFHHSPKDRLGGFIASIRRVLKPGGRLVLRDHDVPNKAMTDMVALAHDVFNAGVKLTWEDNHAQLRHFRSIAEWSEILSKSGFRREGRPLAQAGDPTDNLLVSFVKA